MSTLRTRLPGLPGPPGLSGPQILAALLAGLLAAAAAAPAHGFDFGLTDARSLGVGGAMRASALGTSALYQNPAGIALSPAYHVESSYMFDDKYDMHLVGASVVDSVTSKLGLGLGYFFRWVGKGWDRSEAQIHNIVLGAAFPIIPQLAIGANFHYVRAKIDEKAPTPDAIPNPYGRDLNEFTLDASLAFRMKSFGISVIGYNLTNLKSPLAPLLLGLSAFARIAMVQIGFDVVLDWYTMGKLRKNGVNIGKKTVALRYMAGVEIFLGEHLPVRAGSSYGAPTASPSVHAGLGYVAKSGSVETGFSYEVNDGWDKLNDFRFIISLRYFAF